jgi:Domain of unknown function (DUF4219)
MASKYGVEKFDGSSYNIWRIKIKAMLVTRGLWSAISVERNKFVEEKMNKGTKISEEEIVSEWELAQEKRLSYMQLLVADTILVKISAATTAKDALEILDLEFSSKTGINKLSNNSFTQSNSMNLEMWTNTSVKWN